MTRIRSAAMTGDRGLTKLIDSGDFSTYCCCYQRSTTPCKHPRFVWPYWKVDSPGGHVPQSGPVQRSEVFVRHTGTQSLCNTLCCSILKALLSGSHYTRSVCHDSPSRRFPFSGVLLDTLVIRCLLLVPSSQHSMQTRAVANSGANPLRPPASANHYAYALSAHESDAVGLASG